MPPLKTNMLLAWALLSIMLIGGAVPCRSADSIVVTKERYLPNDKSLCLQGFLRRSPSGRGFKGQKSATVPE